MIGGFDHELWTVNNMIFPFLIDLNFINSIEHQLLKLNDSLNLSSVNSL
jgi:hypothetical protein